MAVVRDRVVLEVFVLCGCIALCWCLVLGERGKCVSCARPS